MLTPILVSELELTQPLCALDLPERDDGVPYQGARLLVRMQRAPVGYASIPADSVDAASVAREVWRQLGPAINRRREHHGLATLRALPVGGIPFEAVLSEEVKGRPPVSVVLCTRDRLDSLLITLRDLAALQYEPLEIVVVDNAPSSDLTKKAFEAEFGDDPRFRYVLELRRGSSSAKNAGIAAATAEIIAFTDDDVRVDQWWLEGIVRGFGQADDVACVTGLVRAALLENTAELYFDQRLAWGVSCERRIFDLTEHRDDSPLYPYSGGVFGTGANLAMTRTVLRELGGFDEALGAGTLCGGGEELELFIRTILAGHRIVYEPTAVLSHVHRTEVSDLSRQMRTYGSGATAALTAVLLHNRRARFELPYKIAIGVARVSAIGNRTKDNPALPSGLVKRELSGMLLGPWLYLKARRSLRRAANVTPRIEA